MSNRAKWKFAVFANFSGMSESYTPSSEVLSSVVGLLEMDSAELLGDVMLILRKLLKNIHLSKDDESDIFKVVSSDSVILFAIKSMGKVDTKADATGMLYDIARYSSRSFIRALSVVERWANADATSYTFIPLLYKIYRVFLKILDERLLKGENEKESILECMLNVIYANKDYWIYTIQATTEMLQLAARRKEVLARLLAPANDNKFEWLKKWLIENHSRHSRASCPNLCKVENSYAERREAYSFADNINSAATLSMLEDLCQGRPPTLLGYLPEDEANPESMIQRRVQIRWTSRSSYSGYVWCDGIITKYNPETMKHQVVYEDNDIREYNFSTKPKDSFKLYGYAKGPRNVEI